MFFKEVNEIDLGETTIANIFIDIFMPMANGLYVKVYLLGYRQACDPNSNPKFDNNSIAKNLNLPTKLVGVGEGIEDVTSFNKLEFINALFE